MNKIRRCFERTLSLAAPLRDAAFGRHLLLTNISISTFLSGAGDVLQQRYQLTSGGLSSFNRGRTCRMSAAGGVTGVICHYWYIWLDRVLMGHSPAIVLRKVLLDQLVFSPVFIVSFLASFELLRGNGPDGIARTVRSKFLELYKAEWTVWPAAQAFSFYALSTKYRVLWDNVVSLGYDTYTSYIVHEYEEDVVTHRDCAPAENVTKCGLQRSSLPRLMADTVD